MHTFLLIVLFVLVVDHMSCQMEIIRPIPLCVTSDTIREYREKPSKLLIDTVDEAKSQAVQAKQSSTPSGGIKNGKLQSVWYGKILTNAAELSESNADTEYEYYKMLNQWLHLQIKFSSNVKVVIVQAMVNPYGLPWGVFDLEFGCKDCSGINPEVGLEGYALNYRGAAMAIPCSKRTYINPRHPYVYVYDGGARNDFHLNFNFVDIPCRNMEMLQFLIISADDRSKEFARTAVIDHINQDSEDGMPYPYHVRFYKSYDCHKQQHKFKVVGSGDKSGITANDDYERCVLASASEFEKEHKDTKYYQSDWVCKKPERIRCEDYNSGLGGRRNDPDHQDVGSHSLCVRCQDQRGLPFEEGPKQVLTKSDYLRRFHGFSMFFGMISLSVVSIHIARYFKETRGCCLLIGWWFWAHLVLMYAASGAILTGLLLGIFMPPRIELNDVVGLKDRRNRLRLIHYVVGILAAVLCYPACIAVGPIRPKTSKKRISYVWAHTILGYLSVALGILATYFSTACIEVTIYAILTVVMGFVPYIMAFVIQYLLDLDSPLTPKRKYIPVIESAEVKSTLPMAIPRAVALGFLVASTTIFVIFNGIYTWGEYGSAFGLGPCKNCMWKWDAPVEHNKEVRPIWDEYECPRTEFDEYLSKNKWVAFV